MSFYGFVKYDLILKCLGGIPNCCEEIKKHTVKKIEYVTEYVKHWLYVVSSVSDKIFFIDGMCNAGIYSNGHLCTCLSVLNIFIGFARDNPDKKFFIYCNDYNEERYKTLKIIFDYFKKYTSNFGINNLYLFNYNYDISDFLDLMKDRFNKYKFSDGKKRSILLYMDPYKMISSELINKMLDFANEVYSEIIWNFFSSDITRNKNNKSTPNKKKELEEIITRFCEETDASKVTADDVMEAIVEQFVNSRYLKYSYFMQMQTVKHITLYNLIYITPHIEGLRKMKEAAWKVFGFHDTYSSIDRDRTQPNLFGETSETDAYDENRNKIKRFLVKYNSEHISFDDLEKYCLSRTIFYSGNIINNVIKPFIKEGLLIKPDNVNSNKFKGVLYKINKGSD